MTRLLRKTDAEEPEADGHEASGALGNDDPHEEPDTTESKTEATDDEEADGPEATDPDGPEATDRDGTGASDPGLTGASDPGLTGASDPGRTGASDPDGTGDAVRTRRLGLTWRSGALAAALAVLLVAGAGFFHAAHQLRSAPSARNQALTDTGATDRVSGDVADGLARVFSYAPADTAAAERSAAVVLAGRAARQYGELLAQVRANLVEQRITLSTQAVRTGVIELDGDNARVLVFLDQTSRRDKAAPTSAAAQLTVTAKLQGDRWRIVDIQTR
ncbi:hypothetical protein ACIQ62_04840 [Streptomyces sp. NPDC096319]|uniref:hypothetical protein n=1 Tax=Streptomyces sp. NPDC096319 TaxID=3366084 RepID=UPI0038112150